VEVVEEKSRKRDDEEGAPSTFHFSIIIIWIYISMEENRSERVGSRSRKRKERRKEGGSAKKIPHQNGERGS